MLFTLKKNYETKDKNCVVTHERTNMKRLLVIVFSNVKILKAFPIKSGTRLRCLFLPPLHWKYFPKQLSKKNKFKVTKQES